MKLPPAEAMLSALRQVEKTSTGWSACCPAHDDVSSSLTIEEIWDGEWTVACHHGCSHTSIAQAMTRLIESEHSSEDTTKGIVSMEGICLADAAFEPFLDQPQDAKVCHREESDCDGHSERSWPPITRLLADMLPPFPTEVLPDVLKDWVHDVAISTQTPEDMAAMFALGTCAACIGGRIKIEGKDGWLEPTNLFALVALGPANLKSAVLNLATGPLFALEKELREVAGPEVASRKAIWDVKLNQLDRAKRTAANTGDPDDRVIVVELAKELAMTPEPVLPTLVVANCTPEKLAELLAINQGRLASITAEGSLVFSLMKGRYSKGGDPPIDVYLQAHCGDPLIVHRKGSGEVRCESPAMTCVYGLQPDVLKGITHVDSVFRGRGLLGRFLFAAPKSLIGSRDINPPPVRPEVSEAYSQLVRTLAGTKPGGIIRLSAEAKQRFDGWRTEVEAMLADGGQLELIRDWGGKLAGATARLAGILHCVQADPNAPLSEDTMKAAISIARYLVPHGRYVLLAMNQGEADVAGPAVHILNWIRRHGPNPFGQRDAHQQLKGRFRRVDDMASAFEELESMGYIRRGPKPQATAGRPPSQIWEVNPSFLKGDPPARPEGQPSLVTPKPPVDTPQDDETGRSQISL